MIGLFRFGIVGLFLAVPARGLLLIWLGSPTRGVRGVGSVTRRGVNH
jgi:hypothetical protein